MNVAKFSQCIYPLTRVTTSPPNETLPVLLYLQSSLIFPFLLLHSPVHPTRFSFCISSGFLLIFILLSSKNNIRESERNFETPLMCHLYRGINSLVTLEATFKNFIWELLWNLKMEKKITKYLKNHKRFL